MCLLTNARTVAIVFARSAGSEATYCAGVLTCAAGFMVSSFPNGVGHRNVELGSESISPSLQAWEKSTLTPIQPAERSGHIGHERRGVRNSPKADLVICQTT